MGNFSYDRYHDHADQYDRMVQCEDYQSNLLLAIAAIHPLAHAHVVELGAGTARITALLARYVERIHAFELIPAMLQVGREKLRRSGCQNWTVAVASNNAMPLRSRCADIAIEGWSFAQMIRWSAETWTTVLDRAVDEMLRMLKPGGAAVVIETLGTGREAPQPPADWFADMYAHLEERRGFARGWVRTDYRFASADEAAEMIGFFFGEAEGRQLADRWGAIIPECTGLWWRRV